MSISLALTNGLIVTPAGVLAGHAVVVEGSRITSIVPVSAVSPEITMDVGGAYITPGLIDAIRRDTCAATGPARSDTSSEWRAEE